jgi:oxygen-dependent protoporphyrinogen oxidase
MVVRNGKLLPIPEGFLLMAPTKLLPILTTPLFSLTGKLRMGLEWFLPPRKDNQDDESLASFVTRRFGREALDRVVQPLISGIYTAPPEKLSLSATMPRFIELEKKYGSVIKGMRAAGKKRKHSGSGARYGMFVTFKNGLQTIIEGLRAKLEAADFLLGLTALSVERGPENSGFPSWLVKTSDGNKLEANAVLVAGPSKHAAMLLEKTDPLLSQQLSAISYASSAVLHFAYNRSHIAHPLDSFGCVVPIVENKNIIAASFSSVKYQGRAPKGRVLLRAFMGGALRPDLLEKDDDTLISLAQKDLDDLLGLSGKPLLTVVSRWPDSMAQYNVGHLARAAAIRERIARHKGLGVCGNGFEGVGIPDCIREGERAAEDLYEQLQISQDKAGYLSDLPS